LFSAAASMAEQAPTVISFGVCFVACLTIFAEIAQAKLARRPSWSRSAMMGAALGLAAWAQPFIGLSFPAEPGLSLLGVTTSLGLSLGSSMWAVGAFARCRGALAMVAPAAILGLGVAASHGALLVSLSGAADFSFDDAPFCLGIAIASASAAAAFAALKVWRRPDAAAAALAAGLVGSQMLARASIGFQTPPGTDIAVFPALRFAPLVVGSIIAAALAARMAVRQATATSATTDRAAPENPRPSRAPRRAGTASPRPAPVQSVGAPAAGLGRPAPPAR
jgi:NO-binding membrane sensor protein with MHYT domain